MIKRAGIDLLAVILMTVIGMFAFRTVAPSGELIAPVAGMVSVALTIALGTMDGIVISIIAGILLVFTQNADWFLVANFILMSFAIGWAVGWRVPLSRQITSTELIWLGIVAGLGELVLTQLITAGIGAMHDGNWLAFLRINLEPTILCALLDAVFIGPLVWLFRWLGRQLLPVEADNEQISGPVEIDLTNKNKKHKN